MLASFRYFILLVTFLKIIFCIKWNKLTKNVEIKVHLRLFLYRRYEKETKTENKKRASRQKNDDNSFDRAYYSKHFNYRNATKIGKGESPLPHYIMEVLIMTSKTIRNITLILMITTIVLALINIVILILK